MAKQKAFLVGINDYAPIGRNYGDLNGCVNDVKDMANTLVICGFPPRGMRICTDERATMKGILDGLNWLIKGAKKGDSLVFYYSGHGSQVPSYDDDEPDGKDEILCPHDLNFQKEVYIKDDTLRELFAKLPEGVNLEVIMDCCHSGTVTKSLPLGAGMAVDEGTKVRFFPPPFDYYFPLLYNPQLPSKRVLKKDVVISSGLNHTLWAACKDDQESLEISIEGQTRGVFTYHFCKVLRKTSGKILRSALERQVAADLYAGHFPQVLQLETSSSELRERPFT